MRKRKILFVLIFMIFTILILTNNIFAKIPTDLTIDKSEVGEITGAGNDILGIIKTITIFVAVGGAMALGIKYMFGSVEEQAKTKNALIFYVIGALIAFGIVGIVDVVARMF